MHMMSSMSPLRDRHQAGRTLARQLERYAGNPDVLVLALPRGGVPVGYEIAMHLGAPLDVLIVRKLAIPAHAELAMGAIASGGVEVIHPEALERYGVTDTQFEAVLARERAELARRELIFRAGRAPLEAA